MADEFTIFTGRSNPNLAEQIAQALGVRLGACAIESFPDGEVSIRLDEPVRGREVFIVQSTGPPVNEHLVELLAFADACRRASAASITAVVPYFGYARADKREGSRIPVTASMVADLMQVVGINHVLTVDVHAPQLEGFFRVPVDSLTVVPALHNELRNRLSQDTIVVSPDAGRIRMATEYAHLMNTSVVILHKQRESATETEVTHVVGDVCNRSCLIVDDMISTGGTMAESIKALLSAGARPEITVAATHGLLLDGARENLSHKDVREVVVTDTVAIDKDWPQLKVVSAAPLIADAIRQFITDRSVCHLS